MGMFCYQCEQTAKGEGCKTAGVCGKDASVAALQDLVIYQLKGIAFLANEARKLGVINEDLNRYAIEALFTTVTNVNFDAARIEKVLRQGEEMSKKAKELLLSTAKEKSISLNEKTFPASAGLKLPASLDTLINEGLKHGIPDSNANQDLLSLQQLLIYGLKGMAAYVDHAFVLCSQDAEIFAFIHEALAFLNNPGQTVDELVGLNMKCGQMNIRAMELLDSAHRAHFGNPEPTQVSTGRWQGPAIVISGHDLLDLEALLKQTEGTGVNVYTHSEMLPAHGYPGLKKYKHLAGHFGTAWQNQQKEFDGNPAVFVFTTNCIQKPKDSYQDRIFTLGLVGWPGVPHLANRDFSAAIKRAKELGGFTETKGGTLMTGFGHNAILSQAGKIVEAVKAGSIKHFFVVGGCDGAKPGRNYYTEFVEKTPKNTLILTLACGKFRFNHLDVGSIGGIPRILDVGQCNDAFSAITIAGALAKAFNCGLNELPLSLVLSWYEQKAVVILLSLLSLGIKGIRLGPTLPAFITPNILKFLVEKFDIKPIQTPDEDLKAILNN